MRVIGTAGHVDHGKSTLVQALTGIHPDRLKEEQEREMTIDIGFAWFTLPGGEEVGIVDVPGHRDFIENMLAGVGGIDAALFVVAADEGVMPQTREHLSILNILQIQGGVVALTKADLVDTDWMDLVEEDLRQSLSASVLAEAPILRVSARTGQGIMELKDALRSCLADRPPRPDLGRPRLPVDRVFSMPGFGTVVTGTLVNGQLKVGEEVEIMPQGMRGRIRGLQTHKQKETIAIPGSRTAVNISGIDLEEIWRGCVVTHPGDYQSTRRIDVTFNLLPDASQGLKHNTEVKLFIGTSEAIARVRLLGEEELAPGQEGWLQLELPQPILAARGDRYILRRPSPGETLGGGVVIDPHPKGRHKRFSEQTLLSLQSLAQGTPADVLMEAMLATGIAPLKEVVLRSNLEVDAAVQAWQELLDSAQVIDLESSPAVEDRDTQLPLENLVAAQETWSRLSAKVEQEVRQYHQSYPLRPGMPREELKSRVKNQINNSARIFNAILRKLVAAGSLEDSGSLVRQPGFAIRFTPQQEQSIHKLMDRFAAAPFSPPSVKDCQADVGQDVLDALISLGQLTQVSPEVAFRHADYERMVSEVKQLIRQQGSLTAAEVRDHFNTSRRYALAFLEHLDASGVTVRDGDARRLRNP
ncbi:MAG: selB [Chloroflexi bacterium]|nr:selB [Chloroflexota bacterium]